MNSAIIVAAGSGTRFGGDTAKQFLEIQNKPILIHTLERFERCDSINEIILVLSKDEIEDFSRILSQYQFDKIKNIISGGDSRAESVYNGFLKVNPANVEVVAVHDGARPIVTTEEITKTVQNAKKFGAACLVAEVTDTIKEISDGEIVKTIQRNKLRRALTPQCFRYEILKKAYKEIAIDDIATDECFLVEQIGFKIKTVEGSAKNIKITLAEDLRIAELFLEDR